MYIYIYIYTYVYFLRGDEEFDIRVGDSRSPQVPESHGLETKQLAQGLLRRAISGLIIGFFGIEPP